MTTFLDIQTRVLRRVIDAPTAVQAEVPTMVNEAMRQLQRTHNFRVMKRVLPAVTVEGARALTIVPSNWKEFRDKPYLLSNSGTWSPVTRAEDTQGILRAIGDQATGKPIVIVHDDPVDDTTINRFINVYPLPDGNSDYVDGEYRVYIPYWGYVAALVNNTDANWFTNNAEEYLVNHATMEAFALDWDEQRLAVWAQKMAGLQAQVIKTDKMQRVSDVDELVPHIDGGYAHTLRV